MSAEEIVRAACGAWSSLDADEIMRYFAPDATWIAEPPQGPIAGYEAIRKAVEGYLGRMTMADLEILNLVATDDLVMTERVDHFMFDGKRLDAPVMTTFEVVGDKIVAWRDYFDMPPPS
jgi:limonene-1,2-epoxide hydrolase